MMFFQQKTLKSICSQRVKNQNSGFTLVELAVILLLVGLVAGGSLSGWAHYVEKQKVTNTDIRFETILDSLSVYVQNHKRLPCPADPNGDGTERNAGYCYDNSTNSNNLYRGAEGVLPWRELGLPENMVKDGWGRYITYRPAPHLTVLTESLLMQESSDISVHNACRSPVWFSNGAFGGNHLDRAKALFCCNMTPKEKYLTDEAMQLADALPINWEKQQVGFTGGATPVQSAHEWMDPARDEDFAGTFEDPRHGPASPDAPLIRATTHAVTLISHGGNGFLSFMRDGARQQEGAAAMSVDEMDMISQPETMAGTAYHPKATGYDPLGKMSGASDDRVVHLRSDQLFARLGAATCARPAFGICFEGGVGGDGVSKNISFILDSSASMLESSGIVELSRLGLPAPVSRWQLATKAISAVADVLIEKKKENYNGGAGVSAEDVGTIGLNSFAGSGNAAQSYYSSTDPDPARLYTNTGIVYDPVTDDPDVYFDSRGVKMSNFMNIVTPPLAENGGDGRGTPLIESILETAKIKYDLDPTAAQTIVVLADGVDTHSSVPADLLAVLGPTFDMVNPELTVDTATACASRNSVRCYAALFQYTGKFLASNYPKINLSVVDVAGANVLENFYEETGVDGEYVDVSAAPDSSTIVNALLEGSGANPECKSSKDPEVLPSNLLTLAGDIWSSCSSRDSTVDCNSDCAVASRVITKTTCSYYRGPRSYTTESSGTTYCGSAATGCDCTCGPPGSGPGPGAT